MYYSGLKNLNFFFKEFLLMQKIVLKTWKSAKNHTEFATQEIGAIKYGLIMT